MSTAETASFLVSLYWLGAMVGRLLGAGIMTRVKPGKLLGIFGITATVMISISMLTSGWVAIGALVLCGFFNSIMFPTIFTLGIARLGPMTSKGSGLIMTAIVGGAVIPWLIGAVADKVGGIMQSSTTFNTCPADWLTRLALTFVIPALCYLYIAYYGLWGSKPKQRVTA